MNFEFNWKQPATIFWNNFFFFLFFSFQFVEKKSCKESFMYQQWNSTVDIFLKVSTTDYLDFFSKQIFNNSYLDTNFRNYLYIDFLEFFPCWFYIFYLLDFNSQRLIWKMISAYFLWFDNWTFKKLKTAKIQNHSVASYYLHKWLVH